MQVLLSSRNLGKRGSIKIINEVIEKSSDWRTVIAAASSLSGYELDFIAEVSKRDNWIRPSPVKQQLLGQLGFTLMASGDSSTASALIDYVSSIGLEDWRSLSLLHGAVSIKSNLARISLENQPSLISELEQSGRAGLATKLKERITWPGNSAVSISGQEQLTDKEQALFDVGKTQYKLICAACHQLDGEGMTGVAPPLAGSSWVIGPFEVPTRIVLHGLQGPIEVSGKTWDLPMLGFGSNKAVLDDEEIAGILTYIRREWGNQGSPVYPDEVSSVRKKYETRKRPWTAKELIQGSN